MLKVFLCVLAVGCGLTTSAITQNWDMAVAIEDKVEFLDKNATLVGITYQVFKNLKAIAFDDIRHHFIVSDMIEENDTIYRIKLSDTQNPIPIVKNIPDDVMSLAMDPVDDVLYWIDSLNRKILRIPLNSSSEPTSEVLFSFKDEIPQGIAVDSCRRKLYWTSHNVPSATIERSNLDGSEREVVIKGNMFMPSGITVDQGEKRLYWADMGEGIYFRIESAKFDGSDRKIVYADTHQTPFGIAVSEEAIFWTDLNNYALWSIKKGETGLKPEIVRRFNEKPMGMITKNYDYLNVPACRIVQSAIEDYHGVSAEMIVPANNSDYCLNYGENTPYGCKCSRGFTGPRCDINLCHNLCVHGQCYQSSQGYPKCKCPLGYTGERCQLEICKGFCLNDGVCSTTLSNATRPVCKCNSGYSGSRCQTSVQPDVLCTCEDGVLIMPMNGGEPYCRCGTSATSSPLQSNQLNQNTEFNDSVLNKLKDPIVMVFMFFAILLLLVIIAMSVAMYKMRLRRPRIKKRIIVNKNVTPLTCRPQQNSEQCEITIENCCNMNICETPCIQPPQIRGFQRSKAEEKKTLLTSMENGEDLY